MLDATNEIGSKQEDNLVFNPIEVKQEAPNRFLHQRRLIIVDEKCQAIVPEKPDFIRPQQTPIQKVYLNKLADSELEDYLLFCRSLLINEDTSQNAEEMSRKKNKGAFSGDGLILSGLSHTQEAITEKALNFLYQMEYNITKAKFYLLFPTLLYYNQYRHQNQLDFTDDYMSDKIEQYITKLGEEKLNQQKKWKQEPKRNGVLREQIQQMKGESKDLQVIQALILHVEKWKNQAYEAIESKDQDKINDLLLEARQLPVGEEMIAELQKLQESFKKQPEILNEESPEVLPKKKREKLTRNSPMVEEVVSEEQKNVQIEIEASNKNDSPSEPPPVPKPSKKKKQKEKQEKQEKLEAQKQQKQQAIEIEQEQPQKESVEVEEEQEKEDNEQVLQKLQIKPSEFNKIIQATENDQVLEQMRADLVLIKPTKKRKDGPKKSQVANDFYMKYIERIMFYLQALSELDLKGIQIIDSALIFQELQDETWLNSFQIFLTQLSHLSDNQQGKKKKKVEQEYTSDQLFYFKVPLMLQLTIQGIQQNYICHELFETLNELREIYNETQLSFTANNVKEIKHYQSIFMPHFYVMGKKFRVINNWVQTAQYMIQQIPRLKNLIISQKLKPFLEYLNSIEGEAQSKKEKKLIKQKSKTKEESVPIEQESHSVTKSRRVIQVSKLMKDDNMAFYDANLSLKKAFGQHSPQESKEQEPIAQKKQRYNNKRLNRKALAALADPIPQSSLDTIKSQSQELLNLYETNEVYCICRQGGESAISDLQIIKSMDEKNVEQFFHHHVKLQQQVKFMICCDTCEEWFHYECMGIKNKSNSIDKYMCRICLLKQNIPFLILNQNIWDQYIVEGHPLYEDYQKQNVWLEKALAQCGEYIYQGHDLPTVEDLRNFVDLGKKLPCQMLELELLEILLEKIDYWLTGNDDPESRFALSEWLPVQLPEAKELLIDICQKEFLATAKDILQSKGNNRKLKKNLMEKTEQLYKNIDKELLKDIDHQIYNTIQAISAQSELNQELIIQLQNLKNQNNLDCYEQLVQHYEKELIQAQFTLPKLNELKSTLLKLKLWEQDLQQYFKNFDSLYTDNLSQEYYDQKPTLSEVQSKIKEYESMVIKLPSQWVGFLVQINNKATEYIQIIELQLQHKSIEEQFELCRSVYRLKCKLTHFKDLLNNVPKDVQISLFSWLPFTKFN